MNILVTAASKHCTTSGIARPIADDLGSAGTIVNPRERKEVRDVASYDVAVIGSAVCIGRWHADARKLAESHQQWLAAISV